MGLICLIVNSKWNKIFPKLLDLVLLDKIILRADTKRLVRNRLFDSYSIFQVEKIKTKKEDFLVLNFS